MQNNIKEVTVIGAGVMGKSISDYLIKCGLKVNLLDIVTPKISNKENLLTGNLEENLDLINKADWIIEVIIENKEAKKELFDKIKPYFNENTIISTNTSGLSVNEIANILPMKIKKKFLGVHFFNPVAHMHLIEIIPTKDTNIEVINLIKKFCEQTLKKGCIIAKDSPNFIANRIGVFTQCDIINRMENYNFNFHQVDQITGELIMRPKSASFQTSDLVGLDILVNTAQTCIDNINPQNENIELFKLPNYIYKMIENNQLGNKTKCGFYKRTREDKKRIILMWDPLKEEYIKLNNENNMIIEQINKEEDPIKKMCMIVKGDTLESKFVWETLRNVMLYSANLVPEVTDNYIDIDKAMRWGYNWTMGPFEIWDALDIEYVNKRMIDEKFKIPEWIINHYEKKGNFYK